MTDEQRQEILNFAKQQRWTPGDLYWNHTLEVRDYALKLQEVYGGNRDVVEISALLHDVGKAELRAPGHEKISARMAKNLLGKLDFGEDLIEKVTSCVLYEDFSSLESEILRSADSMSLLAGGARGREWYFANVLKNNKRKILKELTKSWEEISFDRARGLVKKDYQALLEKYR